MERINKGQKIQIFLILGLIFLAFTAFIQDEKVEQTILGEVLDVSVEKPQSRKTTVLVTTCTFVNGKTEEIQPWQLDTNSIPVTKGVSVTKTTKTKKTLFGMFQEVTFKTEKSK